STGATLLIRASAGPLTVVQSARRVLHDIDAAAPDIRLVDPLDTAVAGYVSPQRFTTTLLSVFAAVGLVLAAAGVYGVMRYWVASRTGEIGIRVALGARRITVLCLVLGRAILAAVCGIAAGLGGAVALRKVIAAELIGVSATDPVVLAA